MTVGLLRAFKVPVYVADLQERRVVDGISQTYLKDALESFYSTICEALLDLKFCDFNIWAM